MGNTWVLDSRIGRTVPHFALLPEGVDHLMFIPDDIRKCVCFIGAKRADDSFVPLGTGVFVARPVPDTDRGLVLLATAWHVIRDAAAGSVDGLPYVRLNLRQGGVGVAPLLAVDQWLRSNDSSVDAGVMMLLPPKEVDFLAFPLDESATVDYLRAKGLGAGEEVFMAGLFTNYAGTQYNIPVIRTGTIAALSEEKIISKHFGAMDGILVEVRSIGGFSGSPVFLNLGVIRQSGTSISIGASGPNQFKLLGLMHGFPRAQIEKADSTDTEGELVNSGLAVVVPVAKLIEATRHEKIEEVMAQIKDAYDKAQPVVEESTVGTVPMSSIENTEQLLGQLMQVPADEADEVHRGH
jgi:hypothetical protein